MDFKTTTTMPSLKDIKKFSNVKHKKIAEEWISYIEKRNANKKIDEKNDVTLIVLLLCTNEPDNAWVFLKNIWEILKTNNQSIIGDYFSGPLFDLLFVANNELCNEIISFAKNDAMFCEEFCKYLRHSKIYGKILQIKDALSKS